MKTWENNILNQFFTFEYEKNIESDIIKQNFNIHYVNSLEYIKSVLEIPIGTILEYILKNSKRQAIMASDVFQFSDFKNATYNLCQLIKKSNNPGLKHKEIGILLLNDGKERSELALAKYGENHIKTAELLGLAFKNNNIYYLSTMGMMFDELSEIQQKMLLIRLILRNKLISQIIFVSKEQNIDMETFLYDLSETTYIRRRSNIKYILEILENSTECDFSFLANKIQY